ncbi:Gfo/Idh/MocA family protein [Pelagibacterium montanilacus]|uniref:Gfo/Idh/MocA family protein n=1 Tax=Pelagibacterium montanilacus TaxID=2185280 RepID=UPI000F8F2257|nr:Gfo/Idh/MocA family oxidoreductase [Pelagibacterium montanilacus]
MKTLRFGFIGAGFMGKAHAQAIRALPICFPDLEVDLQLQAVAASSAATAKVAARRFGFAEVEEDWRTLIAREDIDVVSILTPNHLHHEMALAAAAAGKHILLEKPMAMTVAQCEEMEAAAQKAGVRTMLCFNYRRTPAVIHARAVIDQGWLGRPRAFRGRYLQDWLADPDAPVNWRLAGSSAGSGTLGDIGSHVVDFAHYLLGDIDRVSAMLRTWVAERPSDGGGRQAVDVDDEVMCMLEFANGAIGSIEATRFAPGRKNDLGFEINFENGSLAFDYERMNELKVCDFRSDEPDFKTIHLGPRHPYGAHFWPIPALGMGYHEVKMIEIHDFARAVAFGEAVHPDFADGVRNQKVLAAIQASAGHGAWHAA